MAREPLPLSQTLTVDIPYRPYIPPGMKIGERGQVTIPQHHRKRFGLKPAMAVEFVDVEGKLVLQKASRRHKSGIGKFYGVLGLKNVRTDDLLKELRGR